MNQSNNNNYNKSLHELVRLDAEYQAAVEIEKEKILKEHKKQERMDTIQSVNNYISIHSIELENIFNGGLVIIIIILIIITGYILCKKIKNASLYTIMLFIILFIIFFGTYIIKFKGLL